MIRQHDIDQWIPKRYSALGIAMLICTAYVAVLVTGVLGYNPGSNNIAADVVWSALTMWLCTGLFITAHDAMHNLILPKHPRGNALVGQLCLLLYAGLSYKRLLKGHIDHHRYPSTEQDPDYWPQKNLPQPFRIVWWYVRFMLEYLTPFPIIFVAGIYHTLAHYVGLDITRLVTMWIIPQVLSSVQLFYFGTYLPHRPGYSYRGTGLTKARSNSYPTWLSLLTCYHFGYHYAHHKAPWVPWWRLSTYHKNLTTTELVEQSR